MISQYSLELFSKKSTEVEEKHIMFYYFHFNTSYNRRIPLQQHLCTTNCDLAKFPQTDGLSGKTFAIAFRIFPINTLTRNLGDILYYVCKLYSFHSGYEFHSPTTNNKVNR
jgi:hypothetical protein